MARNVVLCLDGTSNQYAATNTNVVKLYAMLDRARNDQLAYYQPGIGTFPPPGVWGRVKRWVATRLDLAIAWLLSEHVTDAYRFLMRYYQEGDSIFIFGFSRGAYTARAVAAMLHKVGLLTQGNEELIPFAWDIFKREHDPTIYHGFKKTFWEPKRRRISSRSGFLEFTAMSHCSVRQTRSLNAANALMGPQAGRSGGNPDPGRAAELAIRLIRS